MKVLFCHLGREHLGIEYLSAVLKQSGLDVEVLLSYDPGYFSKQDNTLYNPWLERAFSREKEMLSQICREKPDVVAFSAYTANFDWIKRFARSIKEHIETKIVVGGSHATLVPEIVAGADAVDYVVAGESEKTFVELVRFLQKPAKNCDIDNVFYKKDGKVIKNKISDRLITNLDLLPYPDKALFERHINYRDDFLVMTSRGCPYSCTYCCESFMNRFYGPKYFRQRSVGSMISELELMKHRYRYERIIFFDNIFHYNKEWMKAFLKEYRTRIGVPFKCMGHLESFDREIAIELRESNCYAVNFGIQSMNRRVRERFLNRPVTDDQIWKVFRLCDEAGIWFDADLMFDLPGENTDDAARAASRFKRYKRLNRIKCFNLCYFPKLEIVDIALREKTLSEDDVREIEQGRTDGFFRQADLGDEDVKKAGEALKKLYSILPLLSENTVRWLSEEKRYLRARFLPDFLVDCLKIFIGIKNRDPRFWVYFKNYLERTGYLLSRAFSFIKIKRTP